MNEAFKKLTAEIKAQLTDALSKKEVREFVENTKAAQDGGSFEVIISTEDIDRQGESIDQNGWDLGFFKMNPVVLWAHDYWALPIGVCDDISIQDGKLVAKGRFAPEEANPFAQQVRRLHDLKIVRATSVGFIPKTQEGGRITAAELLEFSFVPVPANPLALSLSKAQELKLDLAMLATKGIEIKEEAEPEKPAVKAEGDPCNMENGDPGEMHDDGNGNMVCMPKDEQAQKPEPETEGDFIIIRVKDPDYFDANSFRTIEISAEKGIKATIGCKSGEYEEGTCKIGTEVQRYLFDKTKWNETDAQAWVDANAKGMAEKIVKGEISNQVNQDEMRKQKWEKLNSVWDIFDAFVGVYLDDATPVADFEKLLDETIGLMKQRAGAEKGLIATALENTNRIRAIAKAGTENNRNLIGENIDQLKKEIAALGELLKTAESEGSEPEEGGKDNPPGETKVEAAGLSKARADLEIYHATRQILRAVDLAVEKGLRDLKNFTPDRGRQN